MKPTAFLRNFLAIAGSAVLAAPLSDAATLYWDGGTVNIVTDGNGLSGGAAGNWNTALTNWDAGASPHVAWNNANLDTAAFGRTGIAGGTVTLTAPITVGGLTIYGTGYTLAASTQGLTFGATNNNITLFGSTGTTASATITGTVGGSGNVNFTSANPVVTGTMTFSGISAGGWSGATTINSNMVLATTTTSGNVNQVLNSTSGITLNGGAIQFNRATNAQLNAISDSAAIGVYGGGTFGVTSADAGGASANETIGAVTLNSGQMNFNWTNNPSSGGNIVMSDFTRSGATSALTLSFGANGRFINSAVSTNTAANEIIGAWATTGGANGIGAQTDYAIYTGGNGTFAARNISASAESTWSTTHAATSNYTLTNASGSAANGLLTATRNINTLRNTTTATAVTATNATDVINLTGHGFVAGDVVVLGGTTAPTGLNSGQPYYVINTTANTFQLSTTSGGGAALFTADGTAVNIAGGVTLSSGNDLRTYGILNGSAATLAIGGNGGTISLPTVAAGNLFVTAGNAQIQIDAPIVDPGVGQALTLVKGGSGALTLRATNTYTGGTVINAGTLSISNVNNLGGAGANVTFNGNATLLNTTGSTLNFSSGTLTVNQGAVANLQPNVGSAGITFATTTGSGNIVANLTSNATMNLGDASGFTGNIQAKVNGNINQSGAVSIQFSSLADTVGSFLQFGGGQSDGNQSINIAFNGSAPLVFNNRRIQMLPRTGSNWIARDTFLSNNSASAANTWTINTDLDWEYTASTSPSTRNFTLAGSNTGNNAFSGLISDGNSGSVTVVLQKQGAGKWIVSGNNTFTGGVDASGGTLVLSGLNQYTGATTFNGGTLVVNTIKDFGTASSLGKPASGAIYVGQYTSTSTLSYVGTGDTSNRTFKFQGYTISDAPAFTLNNDSTTGALIFSAGTFNEYSTSSNRLFTLNLGGTYTGGTNEIQGTIQNHFSGVSDVLNLTKNGNSIWKLSGTNTYTGTTLINGGTLVVGSNAPSAANGALGNTASEVVLGVAGGNTNASLLTGGAFTVGRIVRLATNNTSDGGTRVLTLGGNTADNSEFSGNIFLGTTNQAGRGVTLTAAAGGQVTFSGVIQNPSGMDATTYTVTKSGLGTVILSNTNTYTGATTVTDGTLAVNGSLANTTTTVQSGGTLQGSGSIGGSVTIQSGGTLATGNSIESLATGALSLEALSTFVYEMNKDVAAGVSGDLTAVTGNLTIALTNDANLSLVELGSGTWTVGEKLTLISYTGAWNGGLLKILGGSVINDDSTITFSGATWTFNYNDTLEGQNYTLDSPDGESYVTMTALTIVPEPGAALIGSLGLLALLRRRRN